jgi:hypothetical protein
MIIGNIHLTQIADDASIRDCLSEFLDAWDDEYDSNRCDEYGKYCSDYIENFLKEKGVGYQIDDSTIDDNVSYSTGIIAISWLDENGKVDMMIYQWYVR